MIIESFVVVVVGGMGSLLGAIVAGLLIGEVVSLTTFFAPKLAEIMIFIVMAVVLLVRPSGLFGEAGLWRSDPARVGRRGMGRGPPGAVLRRLLRRLSVPGARTSRWRRRC